MKNKIGKQQKLCVFIKESNWKMTKPSETDNNFHFAKTSDESVKLIRSVLKNQKPSPFPGVS